MYLVPTENTKCYISANNPDIAHVEVERLPLAPRPLKNGEYLQYHCNVETQKVWATVERMVAQPTLEELKEKKLAEISKTCENTITNGIDIGEEHFSLTQNDQINISSVYQMIKQGGTSALYHADGELCRQFTSDEIINIMTKATEFKTYHTTYCNHLNIWIRRCETIGELQGITYGCNLPNDLQAHFVEVLGVENV